MCAFVCLREIGSVVWAQGAACESVPRGAIYGGMSAGGEAAQRFEHRVPRSVEGMRENVRARAASWTGYFGLCGAEGCADCVAARFV